MTGGNVSKTNPMRHLDKLGIEYKVHTYDPDAKLNGQQIADILGEEHDRVFKTLVTVAGPKRYYVFVIPVDMELDLKKAAASVGEKSMDMLPSKELLALTGYVHGGCSPLCMKREMVTTIDSTVKDGSIFYVSAGKVGCQLELSVDDFFRAGEFRTADITRPRTTK